MALATPLQFQTPDLLWPYPFCQMAWSVTPPAVQAYIRILQGGVKDLENQVETLQGRVDKTSQTSSKPPSSDSPFKKGKGKRHQSKGAPISSSSRGSVPVVVECSKRTCRVPIEPAMGRGSPR